MKNCLRICALLLGVLLALGLCACGKEDLLAPDGYQLASNLDVVEYKLYVPNSWTVDERTGFTSAYCNAVDRSNISVMAVELSQVVTPAEYFATYRADFESQFGAMDMVSENTELLIAQSAAAQYVYKITKLGTEYQIMQAVCIHGARAYLITFTATTERYEEHTADLEDILKFFSFTK